MDRPGAWSTHRSRRGLQPRGQGRSAQAGREVAQAFIRPPLRFPGREEAVQHVPKVGSRYALGGLEGEALLVASIDLDLVSQVRERVPTLRDRRRDVYEKWK